MHRSLQNLEQSCGKLKGKTHAESKIAVSILTCRKVASAANGGSGSSLIYQKFSALSPGLIVLFYFPKS
jgi:hypothetical protein